MASPPPTIPRNLVGSDLVPESSALPPTPAISTFNRLYPLHQHPQHPVGSTFNTSVLIQMITHLSSPSTRWALSHIPSVSALPVSSFGRARRSSISSGQPQPTSPYMSVGGQPPTTVRCSSLTRWTSAISALSSRARPSSSPQVSVLHRYRAYSSCHSPLTGCLAVRSWACPSQGYVASQLWHGRPNFRGEFRRIPTYSQGTLQLEQSKVCPEQLRLPASPERMNPRAE